MAESLVVEVGGGFFFKMKKAFFSSRNDIMCDPTSARGSYETTVPTL